MEIISLTSSIARPQKRQQATITKAPSNVSSRFFTLLPYRQSPLQSIFWFLTAWTLLLGVWEIGVFLDILNAQILPPPSETLPYLLQNNVSIGFGTQKTSLWGSLWLTLGRIALGLGLGFACALIAVIGMSESRLLRRLAMPIFQAIAPIAPVAWIPFTIAVIGLGAKSAVFIVFMAVIGSATLSLFAAIERVPLEYLKIAESLQTQRLRLWSRILLPAIAPAIATTVRLSFFGAWMAVLAGEMAGLNSGLGYLIIMGQQTYNMKLVMLCILFIALIGLIMDRGLVWLTNQFKAAQG